MEKDYKAYINHILDAIASIQKYTQGMSFDEFAKDEKTMDAVIRNYAIIGEASRKLPIEFRERYPDVPWKSIIGLRNVLIHDYLGVDIVAVWGNVKHELPTLKKQMESILKH